MALGSNNPFPSVKVVETASASLGTIAAGEQRLFLDPSDHHLKRKNSAGTVTDLETDPTLAFKTIAVSGQSDVVADAATDTLTLAAGTGVTITTNAGTDTITIATSGGAGDVVGPGSATNNNIAVFDSTTGKLIKDGGSTIASIVAGAGTTPVATINGRLTTETGVPVSTADRTAQSTIYFTPYHGNQIGLYTGAAWVLPTFAQLSLALSGLTSGKNYDVFVDYNSGTPQLVLSAAWTNDTTRADAIALQDGVYVKSGTTTYRWVGTIRTTGTTTTEDSAAKRFVWNAYNQVRRFMRVLEATDSWNYTTTTIRQANAAAANQLDYVTGDAASLVDAQIYVLTFSSTGASGQIGVGVDSTTTFAAGGLFNQSQPANSASVASVQYVGYPGLGRHFLSWNERGNGSGTLTWFGDNATPLLIQSGIVGTLWN